MFRPVKPTVILLPVVEYFPLQKIAFQPVSTNLVIALLKEFRLVPWIPWPRLGHSAGHFLIRLSWNRGKMLLT